MTENETNIDGTDHPKRQRWGENYDALPYDTDEFDGGETARLRYEDFDGNECTVTVEVGEFMPHNSWLSLFDADGSGNMHFVRRDGVVLLETYPDDEIDEVGECIDVRYVDTETDHNSADQ